ncbi:ammonium transporter [Pyrodictium abyssi]
MPGFSSGDAAWILAATSMVVLMTMGLGFFYGGMVRRKNVVSMISLSFVSMVLVSLQWVLVGYSLSFGGNVLGGFVGGLEYAGLRGIAVDQPTPGLEGLPHLAFVAFQMTFAAITLAILTSALAERVKLGAFLVFGLLWTTLVYDPVAHWVWGGGWLHTWLHEALGAAPLDFAGGTVVHITSGFAALVLALVVGKRIGYGEYNMAPHNIPLTLIGTALLWFGWFGFNAGSALAADASAANALLVTHIAASAGALAWLVASWVRDKPGSLGLASGAVAGLVAITPAAGYVGAGAAVVIGAVAGLLCYGAMLFRIARGLDESLDAWAVHGMGGLWGAIATGIFADASVGGVSGLLQGNVAQFIAQVVDAGVAIAYTVVVTYIIAKIVEALLGLRVTETEEYVGLDLLQHGEEAYAWGG